MSSSLQKFADKLNEFGLGKFSARQIMWRATLSFEGKIFATYNAVSNYLDAEIFRTTYHLPSLADLTAQRLILTTGICIAIAHKLYGGLNKYHFVIYDETENEWIIFPPDVPKDRYLIFVPPVYFSTDPQQYHLIMRLFPPGEDTTYAIEIPPQSLTEKGFKLLKQLTALTFL